MAALLQTFLCALFLLCPFMVRGETELKSEEPSKKTICLNMIVKDESQVIVRCLTSMLPIIDYWVIVDTGSRDDTQKIIKDFMKEKGIPGELHERPWVNFAHNRNEALKLAQAKGDYVFFMDADDFLEYDPGFTLPVLDKDIYYVTIKHSGSKYSRSALINNHLGWEWEGVLHEAIVPRPGDNRSSTLLDKVAIMYTGEGARSKDPLKFQKDAEILETALKDNPNNARYVFYLAQSYRDAQNHEMALKNYEKRASMGGWDQEVFWSLFQVALLQDTLKMSPEKVIEGYKRACKYRPSRAEPYYYLTKYYQAQGDHGAAYEIAKIGAYLPLSGDNLFVWNWIYDYGLIIELSVSAYWTGKYEECKKISEELLKRDLPSHTRSVVLSNLKFANDKLLEIIAPAPALELTAAAG